MIFRFKARIYWLISLILFVLAIGFVLLCIYSPTGSNTIFIVLMTIDLVLMTFAIQIAIQKSIKFRPKQEKYNEKVYIKSVDFDEVLKENKFDLRNRHIGRSYIKIIGKNAYKVVLINDSDKYFDQVEEQKDDKLAKRLDACDTFTGIEIFLNPNDLIKEKIIDFSIQADRVYYTALMKEDDKFVCKNYLEPNEKHKENVNYVLDLLGLSEEIKEEKVE